MINQCKLAEALYEHIKEFERGIGPVEDENWDVFIGDIKRRILFKQLGTYEKRILKKADSN